MKKIEIPEIIVENFFLDLKRKDIGETEKAEVIRTYRNAHHLTQRAFGRKFGIPHSTVQDWERILKLSTEQVSLLKEQGFSRTDIYRELRNNQKNPSAVAATKFIDIELKKAIQIVRPLVKDSVDYSTETLMLIKELINCCNRLLMRVDK